MRRFTGGVILVTAVVLGGFSVRPAAPEAGPCDRPGYDRFDFWLGEWEVTWPESDGREGRARNVVRSILDGCVVLENFDASGPEGNGLVGKSVSTFNPRLGVWQQTWVDNRGSYLDFTGEFRDGKMILVLNEPVVLRGEEVPDSLQGRGVHRRMVWFNIEEDSFDWSWERSLDGGATWEVTWPLHYRRLR